jgi:hypothetical protein
MRTSANGVVIKRLITMPVLYLGYRCAGYFLGLANSVDAQAMPKVYKLFMLRRISSHW